MSPDQAVALAFCDDAALNLAAFAPHPAIVQAPFAVVSSRDEDDGQPGEQQEWTDYDPEC